MPTTPDIRVLVENFTNELSQVMRRAALEEVHAKLSLAKAAMVGVKVTAGLYKDS